MTSQVGVAQDKNQIAPRVMELIREKGVRNIIELISGDGVLDFFFDGGPINWTEWSVISHQAGVALVRMPWTIDERKAVDRSLFTSKGQSSGPVRQLDPNRYTDIVLIVNADPSRHDYYRQIAEEHVPEGRFAPIVVCERWT